LIVDEALSVGDGAFARKSFDRIMAFRDAGKTILFCSHSLYQIEAICTRALWLDGGKVRLDGAPAEVVSAYGAYLDQAPRASHTTPERLRSEAVAGREAPVARITGVRVAVDGEVGKRLTARSGASDLSVCVAFASEPSLPAPGVAVAILRRDGLGISSALTTNDAVVVERDAQGQGNVCVRFPALPLLKGSYLVDVYLLCERGIHLYDSAGAVAELNLVQDGLEQGLVSLPRTWSGTLHAWYAGSVASSPEE
jgi:lipopolysaccharide transport system ATP-binding protein